MSTVERIGDATADLVARLRARAVDDFEMLDDIHLLLDEAADALEASIRAMRGML